MSTLLILLPAHPPQGGPAQDYEYWFSHDAQAPAHARGHGERAPLSALPRADRVMALIGDDQLSWLPAQLPKVKGAKLRGAVVGVMEDQLLEDPERLHFALLDSPDADGRTHWVAVTAREPLRAHLQAIEAAGTVDRFAFNVAEKSPTIESLNKKTRRTESIALEIALNDDAERRLLELELKDLEERWRDEELLAAIVDDELTPVPALEKLRRLINPAARPEHA